MREQKLSPKYEEIIDLPYPVSSTRRRMPMIDRAAQFSPFAALTGYEDAVRETARLTDERFELTEDQKQVLSEKMNMILACLEEEPRVRITYFVPDAKKEGGTYARVTGIVRTIDEYERYVELSDHKKIPIDQIREIEGDLF